MVSKTARGKEYVGASIGDFHGPALEEECVRQNAEIVSDPPSCVVPSSVSVDQPVTWKDVPPEIVILYDKREIIPLRYPDHMSSSKEHFSLAGGERGNQSN